MVRKCVRNLGRGPGGPTEYRKLPKTTEYYRKQSNTTEYYRKIIYPKYRKLPKTTQCWFLLMLECTEKYQSTPIQKKYAQICIAK